MLARWWDATYLMMADLVTGIATCNGGFGRNVVARMVVGIYTTGELRSRDCISSTAPSILGFYTVMTL